MPSSEEVARGLANGAGSKGKKRGSVNNAGRLEAFRGRGKTGGADWGACDPKWLQAVVVGISRLGGAVTFGLSRDQGAHFLTLLLDDGKETLWYNGDADLDDELEAVAATLDTMS